MENKIVRKPSLTIGIPAFNEAGNIGRLLLALSRQSAKNYYLEKIILNLDACTDSTAEDALSADLPNLEIVENETRQGTAFRQNEIIKKTDSDLLLLLNADIMIKDPSFIDKLVQPVSEGRADLVAAKVSALPPKTAVEKALFASHEIKAEFFAGYKGGHNVYTCKGPARAFSRRFYQELDFPACVGEDIYAYFRCLEKKCAYRYAADCEVFIKLPDNYPDHKKQSSRFIASLRAYGKIYGQARAEQEFYFPKFAFLRKAGKYFFKKPFAVFLYACILALTRLSRISEAQSRVRWEISDSSKKVYS